MNRVIFALFLFMTTCNVSSSTSTGQHNNPCFDDGTCNEGLFCDPDTDLCILPEENCGERVCGLAPNSDYECGSCSGAMEYCLSGQCVVLEWQNPPAGNTMTWQSAIDYCEDLSLNGHSDWHLPSIGELRVLIRGCPATVVGGSCRVTDECIDVDCWERICLGCEDEQGPANGDYWPDQMEGMAGWYWSSSAREDWNTQIWYVGFYAGTVFSTSHDIGDGSVRCVR